MWSEGRCQPILARRSRLVCLEQAIFYVLPTYSTTYYHLEFLHNLPSTHRWRFSPSSSIIRLSFSSVSSHFLCNYPDTIETTLSMLLYDNCHEIIAGDSTRSSLLGQSLSPKDLEIQSGTPASTSDTTQDSTGSKE